MKLIRRITIFPLISTLSLYLVSIFFGEVLIRGQHLKEGGAYFNVREIHHIKFQNFVLSFSTMKIKHKTSKPKNKNKSEKKNKAKQKKTKKNNMKTSKYQ